MKSEKVFNRIVLATDGTEGAQAAVLATIDIARFTPAVVRVVHIWNLEVHHRHGYWDVEVRSEAEHLVQETVDQLTRAGVMAEKEIFRADNKHVAASIALIAHEFKADLVVIGSRGLSDWRSLFEHSVSHEVLASVDCPVLIARSLPQGGTVSANRILVAVAGGADVAPAVRAAAAVAGTREGCSVMVVHVLQSIIGVQGFAYAETEAEANAALDEAVALFKVRGIDAHSQTITEGPVATALVEAAAAWNADLIVTGSSRMGDASSLLLGSVSHDLLHRTDIPVLIAARP
jgi:nucleotide-binding universal stress UspA family protein